jgi:iron complex transport system substrate-binding protein
MFRKLTLVVLTFALLLAACTPAATPAPAPTTVPPTEAVAPVPTDVPASVAETFTDGLGREVSLTLPAQKIVSIAPSNTELIFAVGAGTQLVGRDTFSDYPAEALALPDLGSGYPSYNVEAIIALAPDLVLASPLTASEQIQSLADQGLSVYVLPNPKTLDDLYLNLLTVGKLTGHEAEATALVNSLQARVKSITEKTASVQEKPLVFYELDASQDANAPWTTGPGTFMEMLLGLAGARNAGSVLQGEWATISLEELLQQDPDFILLGDALYGGVTPEAVAARPGWETLTAVKEGRVYEFDDNTVSRPGPRMVDGLEALAKLLHPELFK